MKRDFLILFFSIVVIATFLRLFRLDTVPPGINQDEGAIGYNAYSILRTGKDEYGRPFPVSFQSFGDWKLPLYIYATVPLVGVFGITEVSVRLVSALAGVGTVILTFFLIYELFNNYFLAFLSMFLLAISPWHLHISRVESEANTAVFFVTLATLLFLRSLRTKDWLIIPSSFFFVLTYYTYAGNHVFTTLLLLSLVVLYWKQIPRTKYAIIAIVLFASLFSIIAYFTLFEASKTKISGIGIFGDPSVVHAKIEIPRNEHTDPGSIAAKIFHNKIYFGIERFMQNYLNAFSPEFLFIKGGTNHAHNIEGFGNMYIVESLFFLTGFIYLIVTKKNPSHYLVILWLLIAPIAPSVTKDAPHSNRMFAIFPMLPVVTASGFYYVFTILRKNKILVLSLFCISFFLLTINFGKYIDQYYVHFPRNEGEHWGVGYKRLLNILNSSEYRSKHIVMSHPEYSHYMYLLFYDPYDPEQYQKEAMRYAPTSDGFYHVKSFGRYEFRNINWEYDIENSDIVVSLSKEVPENIKHAYKTEEVILDNNESMFTVIKK